MSGLLDCRVEWREICGETPRWSRFFTNLAIAPAAFAFGFFSELPTPSTGLLIARTFLSEMVVILFRLFSMTLSLCIKETSELRRADWAFGKELQGEESLMRSWEECESSMIASPVLAYKSSSQWLY